MIRMAKPADAEGILAIYAPFIRDTSLTFETEVPSHSAFAERIRSYLEQWPWLINEENGIITGYAYATRHRERIAYQWSVEASIYLQENATQKGLGKQLYTKLMAILREQGFRNVYAVINLPNDKSVRFHESCGFRYFATYPKAGYKLGKWKDIGWWQLTINDYSDDPAAPIPLARIGQAIIQKIIQ